MARTICNICRQEFLVQPSPMQEEEATPSNLELYESEVFAILKLCIERLVALEAHVNKQPLLEEKFEDLERRLTAIEIGQKRMEDYRDHEQTLDASAAQRPTLGEGASEPEDSNAKAVKEDALEKPTLGEGADIEYLYQGFEETVWDTTVLIGLRATGSLASVFAAMLLVINFVVQLGLCFMINDYFTVSLIDSSHTLAMRRWRASFGHDAHLINQMTHQSFVSSLCNMQSGLQFSTEAANLFAAITAYLPRREDYEAAEPVMGRPLLPYMHEYTGMILSAIAIFIWLMIVSAYLQGVCNKGIAIKTVPSGKKTKIVKNLDSHTLISMTSTRKKCCLLVFMIRVLVLLFLGFCGTFYIIRTLSMKDMLLNCSALAIVLDLDGFIFAAFIPERTRHLLTSMEALPRPAPRDIRGMSWNALISILLVVALLWASCWELGLQAVTLRETHTEICGGNLNFVASPDRTGVITASKAEPVAEEFTDTYAFRAMRQLILDNHGWVLDTRLGGDVMSAATSGLVGGPWSLKEWTEAPLDDVVLWWNARCEDMLPVTKGVNDWAGYFLEILQDSSRDNSLYNCTDVRRYCNWDTEEGVQARTVCPVTCSCNHPWPRLALGGTNNGCSPACYTTAVYNTSMWSRECQDLELDSPYWSLYAESVSSFVCEYPPGWDNLTRIAEEITANGCGLLSMPFKIFEEWHDPCKLHAAAIKPLTYACPISCGCKERNRYLCPNTCGHPA